MPEYHLTVESQHHHQRVDVFLTQVISDVPSRTFIKQLITEGQVLVNGQPVKPHHKVSEGDVVDVNFSEPEDLLTNVKPEAIDLDIFYEDDFLMIINKPAGMLVHPVPGCSMGTMVNALLHYGRKLSDVQPAFRPGIVHRLDRETSGLLCVAKDNQTHVRMARQFEKHKVFKCYVALVKGYLGFDEGKIDLPLGRHPRHFDKRAVSFAEESKEATTFYRVMRRFKHPMTLVALFPQSGRTHQLRVHMAHLGHPILGDDKYGQTHSFSRLALHAQQLGFSHPQTRQWIEFCCPPPPEMLNLE